MKTLLGVQEIASLCHEANRLYCLSLGEVAQNPRAVATKREGRGIDPALVPWKETPAETQESAVQGVLAILKNPYLTPEKSHESWFKFKEERGWKYGEVKDQVKKEHPCFLPYEKLPEAQKAKDHIFGGIVRVFFAEPLPQPDSPEGVTRTSDGDVA